MMRTILVLFANNALHCCMAVGIGKLPPWFGGGQECYWGSWTFQNGEKWQCNDSNNYDSQIEQCNECYCSKGIRDGTKKLCPSISTTCPIGWTNINHGCYRFYAVKSNWYEADQKCKGIGGRLAQNIEKDLPELMKHARQHHNRHSWWIGMSNIEQEGNWFWKDGSFGISRSGYYLWWASSQPNKIRGNEDCSHLLLWNGGDMLLGDTPCSSDMARDGKFEFRPLCQKVVS